MGDGKDTVEDLEYSRYVEWCSKTKVPAYPKDEYRKAVRTLLTTKPCTNISTGAKENSWDKKVNTPEGEKEGETEGRKD